MRAIDDVVHGSDYEQAALRQGHVAVNSILRDWIKGQMTAIECGILSFEAVFMPYMLTGDGRPLIERLKGGTCFFQQPGWRRPRAAGSR